VSALSALILHLAAKTPDAENRSPAMILASRAAPLPVDAEVPSAAASSPS